MATVSTDAQAVVMLGPGVPPLHSKCPTPPPPDGIDGSSAGGQEATVVSWLLPLDRRSQPGTGLSNMADSFHSGCDGGFKHARAADIVATSPVGVSWRAGSTHLLSELSSISPSRRVALRRSPSTPSPSLAASWSLL